MLCVASLRGRLVLLAHPLLDLGNPCVFSSDSLAEGLQRAISRTQDKAQSSFRGSNFSSKHTISALAIMKRKKLNPGPCPKAFLNVADMNGLKNKQS